MVLVDRLTHTGAFGPRGAIGFSAGDQSAYILPMRGGNWRRGMALTCWNEPRQRDQDGLAHRRAATGQLS